MESWLAIVISLCIGLLVKAIVGVLFSGGGGGIQEQKKLPPGPHTFPIIGTISWLRKSSTEMEAILRKLHSKYGPLVTLRIGGRPAIFVADSSLAHQALVQNGAVFADRPPALLTNRNQLNINSAHYGPTWRLLRRNLTAEILHPSRIKSYSDARRWVLHLLLDRLRSSSGTSVRVVDHFHYAMFCLLVLMCFGDKLDEPMIKEIETVQRSLLLSVRRFGILNFWPKITGILLRRRWQELFQLRRNQEAVLAPLIEARRKANSSSNHDHHNDHDKDDIDGEEQGIVCYVDTLLDLQLPEKEEKRKLETGEIVTLCSEFLVAGTDTTSTALQWIMANIVKHPEIQEKLYAEMKEAAPPKAQVIEEEDLRKMEYLKAVVLEGLRRHPPGHFVLPHAVTEEEVVLGGHAAPKEASINFLVAEIGWDPKVWQDPMAFRPERFLGGEAGVDITGSKEIKMMPFGAGRRICPGFGLAMLHLEYFVANLVWSFEWKAVEGDEVDMSEKQEFTTVMKYPLKAKLYPRL